MAARFVKNLFQTGTKSVGVLRNTPCRNNVKTYLKSLHKTSSSSLHVNPALSSILQNLAKRSPPLSQIRRLQDLAVNIDTAVNGLSTNQDNSQDISLLEQCSEDDDEQFRKRDKDVLKNVKDEIKCAAHNGNIFAIVYIGGSQFKITINDIIMVNKLDAEVGSKIKLEKVLLVGGENFTIVGRPLVDRSFVDVQATITEHTKSEKIIVFKKKRRKGYKRTQGKSDSNHSNWLHPIMEQWYEVIVPGHRQALSVVRISKIALDSTSL